MKNVLFCLFAVLLAIASPALADSAINVDPLRSLPVLDHGRVKPMDTLARETVQFVTGYERFGIVKTDEGGEQQIATPMDPLAVMLDWSAHPVQWQTLPVLYVRNPFLRAKLNLKPTDKWISPRALLENADFATWVRAVEGKRMTDEQNHETTFYDDPKQKLLDDAAVDLDQKVQMFEAATDLKLIAVLPPDGAKSDNWLTISSILGLTGTDADVAKPVKDSWDGLMAAYIKGDNAAFADCADDISSAVLKISGPDYFNKPRLDREVLYNFYKPFQWTSVLYILSVIMLVAALMVRNQKVYIAAMSTFGLAIAFHGAAFAWRCSITGWAPVTNMYETVIWVAMMSAVFSYILELVYRKRVIAIGGATVAVMATLVALILPPEYGNSIRNLTPVLRSNYWLLIHVLTIVSSYAAFALAMVLGDIVLGQFIHGKISRAVIQTNLLFTYRAVQIGVLLVAAGTILGGLWADVSWGRFWGWDPKEVWALIVLLTYLSLLHGRYAGWIKQFGMAAGAVVCFTAVLMSWYGVNFVLGAGLHSYGFGAAVGQFEVACFVLAQWAYVGFAWMVYRARHPRIPPTVTPENPQTLQAAPAQ